MTEIKEFYSAISAVIIVTLIAIFIIVVMPFAMGVVDNVTDCLALLRQQGYTCFADRLNGDLDVTGYIRAGTTDPEVPLQDGSIYASTEMRSEGPISCMATEDGIGAFVLRYAPHQVVKQGIGTYDKTGGAREKIWTSSVGGFTQEDADKGRILAIFEEGINYGKVAEIDEYINNSQVTLDASWPIDISASSYIILNHPIFGVFDGNITSIDASGEGHVEIHALDHVFDFAFEIEVSIAEGNEFAAGQVIDADANGVNGLIAERILYTAGNLSANEVGGGQHIIVSNEGADNADATTVLAGSTIQFVDTGANTTFWGYTVLPGSDQAYTVLGSPAIDPQYGYEITGGVVTDRVNSGGGGNDAFINPAVNVEVLDSNGDYILIGSNSTFEIMSAIFAIGSGKDCVLSTFYTIGNGSYSPLGLLSESTVGFQNSGQIVWESPGNWVMDDEAEVNGDITNAYYIKIERNYNPPIVILPTELYFKIFANREAGWFVRGDGTLKPVWLLDADVPNDSIYRSLDSGILSYKEPDGTVRSLW